MKRILLRIGDVGILLPCCAAGGGSVDVSIDFFYDNIGDGGSWVEVADYGYCWQPAVAVEQPKLASVFGWVLGLHRRRLDVGFLRGFRMGHLSLRAVDPVARSGLGLGAGAAMGSGLGFLAHRRRLCGLGASPAAAGAVIIMTTPYHSTGGHGVRHRTGLLQFRRCALHR